MPAPTITPLPTPPSRSTDPTNFAIEADAFVAALPDFATEANAQADYLDELAAAVDADAAIAAASATIATGAANYQGDYNAGTTYQIGESVSYSGRRYVAKTINTGVTPVDGANWLIINDGDVSGPASATANGIALYDGTTGKIIKAGPAPSTAGNVLTSDGTTWQSITPPSNAVNYPQNSRSANYTLVLGDAGKQIFHPASDTAVRTYTIPANSVVAFPIGTVVLFNVENGAFPVTVAINTDTLVGGDGTTGSISVPSNNTLMAIKVTATKWMANYLYQATISGRLQAAFTEQNSTSTNAPVYTWTDASGFGGKYADPSTAIPLFGQGIAFAPNGSAIAVTSTGSPYISAYAWSYLGFGAKYANPATLPPNNSYRVAFSPFSNAIAVSHTSNPFISVYPWNSTTGFGTKYANPATLPAGNGLGLAFSPDGNSIALGHEISPFISAYPWNSTTGFGTKFTNPATLPPAFVRELAFSPAGDALATAVFTSPFASVYPWNSSTGFGTRFSNPSTAIAANTSYSIAFHPTGNAIVVGLDQAVTGAAAYAWSSSGWGVRLTNYFPSGALISTYAIAFSPSGNAIMLGGQESNTPSGVIKAYRWTSTGFGASYSTTPVISGASYGVAFNTSF